MTCCSPWPWKASAPGVCSCSPYPSEARRSESRYDRNSQASLVRSPCRPIAAGDAAAEQRQRVQYPGTHRFQPAGPAAAQHRDHRGADRARLQPVQPVQHRSGPPHLPALDPGQQRDPVLPPARGAPGRNDADHLHPHGRPGLPGVLEDLPDPPRPVHLLPGPRADRRHPAQRHQEQREDRGGHRQRADPRPRRPGHRRDGHPDRQAVPVHRLRRYQPGLHPAGGAGRRHQQPGPAQRPDVHGLAPRAGERGAVRGVRRPVHPGDQAPLAQRPAAIRGLRPDQCHAVAGALQGRAVLLQRRHPGHRRGGRGHPCWRLARPRARSSASRP